MGGDYLISVAENLHVKCISPCHWNQNCYHEAVQDRVEVAVELLPQDYVCCLWGEKWMFVEQHNQSLVKVWSLSERGDFQTA